MTGQVLQHASNQVEQYSDIYVTVNEMLHSFVARVPYLIISIIVFALFLLLSRLYKSVLRKVLSTREKNNPNLIIVLSRIGSSIILFMGLLISMVIAIPNFTPSQLISMLGIGSLAIGFAFKDIFQNLLSGIMLLLSEPFKIGDHITTGSYTGTVETIDVRATIIRTDDGKRILVPNSQLYTGVVTVDTAYKIRRLAIELAISYLDDLEKAKKTILDVLYQSDSTLKDTNPPAVIVSSLTSTYAVLTIQWWIEIDKKVTASSSTDQVLAAIKYALQQNGFQMPVPVPSQLPTPEKLPNIETHIEPNLDNHPETVPPQNQYSVAPGVEIFKSPQNATVTAPKSPEKSSPFPTK